MGDDLAAKAAPHFWFHTIDLGGGVVTAGYKSRETLDIESSRILSRVDFRGRSVLDIGAWTGYFSFEAERRGAARVLATDSYCWTSEQYRGREPFDFARNALKSSVQSKQIDVADLSVETVGQFDVVLYLGVFYHRYDAIEVLGRVSALARELLIVETQLDLRDLNVPAMRYYPGSELNDDETNWWGPNEQLVEALLRKNGFTEIESSAHPQTPYRGIFHGWRSTAGRLKVLPDEWQLKPWASRSPPSPPSPPLPPSPATPESPPRLTVPQKIIREIGRPFRPLKSGN